MAEDRTGKSPQLLGLEKAIAEGQLAVRRPVCELIVTYTDDTDDMSEVDRLKSLLRELLPLIKALPKDENAIELIGAGLELSNPVTLRDYIDRIREAVK